MKKLTYFVLLLMLSIGCQESSSILGPEFPSSLEKRPDQLSSDLTKSKYKFSKNNIVNGDSGGVLNVKYSYLNDDLEKVSLTAKLIIPEGAFEGELEFKMFFDIENYEIDLYPSPYSFNKPLELDLSFSGVEFDNYDVNDEFIFTYLDGNEEIEFELSKFDPEKKVLAVKKAKIHHFSRYGWGRIAK